MIAAEDVPVEVFDVGVTHKAASYFGNCARSGGTKAEFDQFAEKMLWNVLGSTEFIGSPKANNLKTGATLASDIARMVKMKPSK